jgi:chromosome segregation ATPase
VKRLHIVNFIGVLALAALCVAQWQHNRRLNLEVNRFEKARIEQAARLTEQEQRARELDSDLTHFKLQFTRAQAGLDDTRKKLQAAERDARQFSAERDQLKTSVTNWAAAVATRDERLKEANVQIRKLADELNASVRKFNELATNHNALVKEVNELRARPAPASANSRSTPPAPPQPNQR